MSTRAPDHKNILKLFNVYLQHKKTRIPTLVGFKAFMLRYQNYPAWMVRNISKQINEDTDLKYHINVIAEAGIVENALTGVLKGDMSKFILKNHYGYKDTNDNISSQGATVKQISFVPATIEHKEANDEQTQS